MKISAFINIIAFASLLAFPRMAYCDLRIDYFEGYNFPFLFTLLLLLCVITLVFRSLEKYRKDIENDNIAAGRCEGGARPAGSKNQDAGDSPAPQESLMRLKMPTLNELIVFVIILIIYPVAAEIGSDMWPSRPNPGVLKARAKESMKEIRLALDRFYADHGRYPRELTELVNGVHPYFAELPKNPFTGKADWEVRERYLPERWYSSPDLETNYPGSPGIKWSPGPESGIYDVRPRVKMIR